MRKTVTAIAVIVATGLVASLPAAASAKASKQETIGVGAGGVIGAVAGGPVGFIVGAAIGAKIGDSFHRQSERIETLSMSLDESGRTIDTLEQNLEASNRDLDMLSEELQQLERNARPELVNLMQSGIALDLLFRTDEHVLADTTDSRLAELAATLASMPDIQVRLDGFADERGAESYNQSLSEKRVDFVRQQLLAAGVDPTRISATAHGESAAAEPTVDSYALERRVSLTLFIQDPQPFASNPE